MKQKIKILIVDSSRLFRAMLGNILDNCNSTTFFCATANEALEQLQRAHYDIICASYHLDSMSGNVFCQKVRNIRDCQHVRVILFTSEDNKELLKQALLAGATDIYSKDQFPQFKMYLQRLVENVCHSIIGQILLIEDSPSQLMWMKTLLIEYGLDVDSFSNADQALDAFLNNNYDLVISDIVLEGSMSGLSLIREIRRDSTDKGLIPIFAISAYDDVSRRMELYHVGVNDYMTKPIIAEEFVYRVANLIQNYRVINELSIERKHLQEIALLDSVTGLYNRNAFDEFAPRELAQAERARDPISVAVLDIDHFKKVNDEYGHDKGDQVLGAMGQWLRNALRKDDLVFRWGGEEFVILLINCSLDRAMAVLEKQRIRFNKREYAGLNITVSIGVSSMENFDKKKTIPELFKEADQALYNAKETGRNKICRYE